MVVCTGGDKVRIFFIIVFCLDFDRKRLLKTFRIGVKYVSDDLALAVDCSEDKCARRSYKSMKHYLMLEKRGILLILNCRSFCLYIDGKSARILICRLIKISLQMKFSKLSKSFVS